MTDKTVAELKTHGPKVLAAWFALVVGSFVCLDLIELAIDHWKQRPVILQSIVTATDWGGLDASKEYWQGENIYCFSGAMEKRPGCGWPEVDPDPTKWVKFWQTLGEGAHAFPIDYKFSRPPVERPGGWTGFEDWCVRTYAPTGLLIGSVTHECAGRKVGPHEFLRHEIVAP